MLFIPSKGLLETCVIARLNKFAWVQGWCWQIEVSVAQKPHDDQIPYHSHFLIRGGKRVLISWPRIVPGEVASAVA